MKQFIILATLVICDVLAVDLKSNETVVDQLYPTLLFHGLGDTCGSANVQAIIKEAKNIYGTDIECVNLSGYSYSGWEAFVSVFYPSDWMAAKYCSIVESLDLVKNNEYINIIGMSQGALNARFIIEACDLNNTKVYNYLSIGGPHMGSSKVPNCIYDLWYCHILNWLSNVATFLTPEMYMLSTTGILRNHSDDMLYQMYLYFSPLLASLNNEKTHENQKLYKNRIKNLNRMVLYKFDQDTIIYPNESEWFEEIDSQGEIVSFRDTDLYKQDMIGLQELDKSGRIFFNHIKNYHLKFSYGDIDLTMLPSLYHKEKYVFKSLKKEDPFYIEMQNNQKD